MNWKVTEWKPRWPESDVTEYVEVRRTVIEDQLAETVAPVEFAEPAAFFGNSDAAELDDGRVQSKVTDY